MHYLEPDRDRHRLLLIKIEFDIMLILSAYVPIVVTLHSVVVKGLSIKKFVAEGLQISLRLWTIMLALILLEVCRILPTGDFSVPVLARLTATAHFLYQILQIYNPCVTQSVRFIATLIHLIISVFSLLHNDFEQVVVIYDLTIIILTQDIQQGQHAST